MRDGAAPPHPGIHWVPPRESNLPIPNKEKSTSNAGSACMRSMISLTGISPPASWKPTRKHLHYPSHKGRAQKSLTWWSGTSNLPNGQGSRQVILSPKIHKEILHTDLYKFPYDTVPVNKFVSLVHSMVQFEKLSNRTSRQNYCRLHKKG